MPTIVLLDVSLSMARPVPVQDSGETYTRLQLAIHGINTLLDYFNAYTKLEFVSLLTYSSVCEVLCPFTRDFESIKQKLQSVEDQDKTCIEPALHAVNRLVLNEWGSSTPCHVIIVSDGSCGATDSSFKHLLDRNAGPHRPPLPFAFPGKLSALIISNVSEPQLTYNLQLFKRLTDLAGGEGLIHTPEGALSIANVQAMVRKMAEAEFISYQGTLRCGCLSSKITLSPHPLPYTHVKDFSTESYTISNQLQVVGFLELSDIGSPAAVSRHLVLPMGSGLSNHNNHADVRNDDSDDENHDEGKTPSFCVLLHGALKVENMAALCEVAEGWFGILFSWADNKKKSNLMLTVLEPGTDAIPWLGDLEQLGSAEDAMILLGRQGEHEDVSALPTFPVRPTEKRSYSQSTVAWIRQAGLHSDIQKILRSARKLPDKTQHFYKELNRVRKAAVQVGFMELLDGLSKIFEKECTALPDKAHPDCALQLTHCASVLKRREARELKFTITPLRTSFHGVVSAETDPSKTPTLQSSPSSKSCYSEARNDSGVQESSCLQSLDLGKDMWSSGKTASGRCAQRRSVDLIESEGYVSSAEMPSNKGNDRHSSDELNLKRKSNEQKEMKHICKAESNGTTSNYLMPLVIRKPQNREQNRNIAVTALKEVSTPSITVRGPPGCKVASKQGVSTKSDTLSKEVNELNGRFVSGEPKSHSVKRAYPEGHLNFICKTLDSQTYTSSFSYVNIRPATTLKRESCHLAVDDKLTTLVSVHEVNCIEKQCYQSEEIQSNPPFSSPILKARLKGNAKSNISNLSHLIPHKSVIVKSSPELTDIDAKQRYLSEESRKQDSMSTYQCNHFQHHKSVICYSGTSNECTNSHVISEAMKPKSHLLLWASEIMPETMPESALQAQNRHSPDVPLHFHRDNLSAMGKHHILMSQCSYQSDKVILQNKFSKYLPEQNAKLDYQRQSAERETKQLNESVLLDLPESSFLQSQVYPLHTIQETGLDADSYKTSDLRGSDSAEESPLVNFSKLVYSE